MLRERCIIVPLSDDELPDYLDRIETVRTVEDYIKGKLEYEVSYMGADNMVIWCADAEHEEALENFLLRYTKQSHIDQLTKELQALKGS